MAKLTKEKLIDSLFFWRKKPKTEEAKAEEMLQMYMKYMPQLKKIMNPEYEASIEDDKKYMYDFFVNYDGMANRHFLTPIAEQPQMLEENFSPDGQFSEQPRRRKIKEDKRIVAKPVDIVEELETMPTPFTLQNLDAKIATLKDKSFLLSQRYAKAQIDGLCKRLENRKKYTEEKEFYDSFKNTTDEKIDKLLSKYKLVINESDLFIPTFPTEAVDVMKKYTEVTERISGQKPNYYVIAEEQDFKKKYEKLDPILLVQSPFGFYWQILGAWDKEMILLSDL